MNTPQTTARSEERMRRTESPNGKHENGTYNGKGLDHPSATSTNGLTTTGDQLPTLPTFPLETGYRQIYNPLTQEWEQQPLTLLDLLYPSEDDVGVVTMSQSPLHDLWSRWLASMLQAYLATSGWLILHDVLIHWGRRAVPYKSPDVTAIQGGQLPAAHDKSYHVLRDGPLPTFVLEITSEETRRDDFNGKELLYAAVGVKEYLIVDLLPEEGADWKLYGFRLEESPFYKKLTPDAEGGLTFETVGLRFVARENTRIDVYDSKTGERLLNPVEMKIRADHEAERAERMAAQLRALGIDPDA